MRQKRPTAAELRQTLGAFIFTADDMLKSDAELSAEAPKPEPKRLAKGFALPNVDTVALECRIVANPSRSTLMDYTRRIRRAEHIAPDVLAELTAACRRILADPTTIVRLKKRAREFLTTAQGPEHY